MSEEASATDRQAIRELSQAVARELARGVNRNTIIQKLIKQGWADDAAHQIVSQVEEAVNNYRESPEARQAMARAYARHMLYGALWAIGGITVTVLTLAFAANGGTYVVAWGAIIFGIVDFFRGLFGWLKYKD
jgi:hypothetical protein